MADWGGSDATGGDVISIAGVPHVLFEESGRTGGSLSWCNCNAGNIVTSGEAESYGAYPGAHNYRFAVFPDEGTGQDAIVRFLSNPKRSHRSIFEMMKLYAPDGDGPNSPTAYATGIASALGLGTETLVDTLDDTQLGAMADSIRQIEGWDAHADSRIEFDADNMPGELEDWLGTYPERSDRVASDQPYADVQAPPSPGIANLQQLLNRTDSDPQLTVDEYFGPKSREAVVTFQSSVGIAADGIVGPGTWRALLDAVGA